jgi:hypothetical protein
MGPDPQLQILQNAAAALDPSTLPAAPELFARPDYLVANIANPLVGSDSLVLIQMVLPGASFRCSRVDNTVRVLFLPTR